MTILEKLAIKTNVIYSEATTHEIMVLGERSFDKLAKAVSDMGKGWHGFRTGCYDDERGEYWWSLSMGAVSNQAMADLVSSNID